MAADLFNSIPFQLLRHNHSEGDISVIVGKNGSGKSRMLADIADRFKGSCQVIGVANTLHDKFRNDSRIQLIRDRQGRNRAARTIKSAFFSGDSDKSIRLKNTGESLRYIGYDPRIGLRIDFNSYAYQYKFRGSELFEKIDEFIKTSKRQFSDVNAETVVSLIERFINTNEEFIWLSVEELGFQEVYISELSILISFESLLKRLGIIRKLEVFLSKGNRIINLLDASSGELNLISTIVYISMLIKENCVILIDEPENSLHPQWQKDYATRLLDLFFRYLPKIIICTHSPLIVNGVEISSRNSKIFKAENFQLEEIENDPINIEQLYFELFNVITPENRFLSNHLINLMNSRMKNEIDQQQFQSEIDKINETIYEEKQRTLIEGFEDLSNQILSKNE